MLNSKTVTYSYENGEIQRVQMVTADSWDDLAFMRPAYSEVSFERLCSLYQDFMVKQYAWLFGRIILYRVPDDMKIPFPMETKYGRFTTKLGAVNAAFKKNIHLKNGRPYIADEVTKKFYQELEKRGCLKVASGNRKYVKLMPVGSNLGFLSENNSDAKLKVNSNFFVMDIFDCGTVYDTVGSPVGLCCKDGNIELPPLYGRETLAIDRDGKVSVRSDISLKNLTVTVDGREYRHRENCTLCERPEMRFTPFGGWDILITSAGVAAVRKGGFIRIPCGGFAIHVSKAPFVSDGKVSYAGLENLKFAVQVGNSVAVNGSKTEKFTSPFCNIKKLWKPSFPPSTYPLDFQKDRAPRIVIGSDENERPVILWLEGKGKFGYEVGKGSCGASLSETADICEKLGVKNGVHLDGGGSAQIMLNGSRSLLISDRNKDDFSEQERAVPVGICIP